MIRINNDYVITVDSNGNYCPSIDMHSFTTDSKTGVTRPVYKNLGYTHTLKGAIELLKDRVQAKILADGDYSLPEALDVIEKNTEEFKKYMEIHVKGN